MTLTTAGQFGPEALIDSSTGRPLPSGTAVSAPAGYTATFAAGNLTVTGPPSDSVAVTVTPPGGSAQAFSLRVEPATAEVAEVAGLARAALTTTAANATYPARKAGTSPVAAALPFLNVKDFGALGNDAADETTAIQAAINALPTGATRGGTIYFPAGYYRTTAPLVVPGYVTLRGESRFASYITNNVSDLLVPSSAVGLRVESLFLSSGAFGGHTIAPLGGFSESHIYDCVLAQNNPAKSIFFMDGTEAEPYIDVTVEDCQLNITAGHTVPGWYLRNNGGAHNSNTWRRLRPNGYGAAVPFFHIENTGAAQYAYDNLFSEITGEICSGGVLRALSVSDLVCQNVTDYDTVTYTGPIIELGTASGGLASRACTLINSGRRGGTLGPGVSDIKAPGARRLTLIGCNPSAGIAVLDIPTSQSLTLGMDNSYEESSFYGRGSHVFGGTTTRPTVISAPGSGPCEAAFLAEPTTQVFTGAMYAARKTDDTHNRYEVTPAGHILLGFGNSAPDARIEWIAPGALQLGTTMRSGQGATGSRPVAGAVGAGSQWYDTTLNKPIFSDGTNWRDAAGTVV